VTSLGLSLAIRTLTRFPVPGKGEDAPEKSLFWFPLVGAVLGLCSYAVALLPFEASVRAALVLALSAYLTRAFHLDGLADFADGLGGGWNRERALEIMRDSHSGAFAVVTLIVVLLLQYSCLTVLVDSHPQALILAPAIGRLMQVLAASALPYARSGEGTASQLVRRASKKHGILPFAQVLAARTLCYFSYDETFALKAFLALGLALLMNLTVMRVAKKRLGGATGDVLGAIEVLCESAALLAFLLPLA
jgi:adenosylcobinamide-GDP ribazoletransferase